MSVTELGIVQGVELPTRELLETLTNKWTLPVLCALHETSPMRHGELRRQLDGVSQKMLTATLRTLERDGIIERTVYPEVPPKVEYRLSGLGTSLAAIFSLLQLWAADHASDVQAHRSDSDAVGAPQEKLSAGHRHRGALTA
ncbi:transcriptional regulator [Streptacidiphilus pinicola]|uniref:Transcriptional regulator n=1 Tax=Streptacidiphilus pinicola TaxID=2219663 RepID=A0A2X0IL05_9ACTN|nr:helix-turn-helix domain-containing protein [Streptacidiphilus pinicola]RAG85307.1 transcriptional regulator [Streptacidiphilus pinicola]